LQQDWAVPELSNDVNKLLSKKIMKPYKHKGLTIFLNLTSTSKFWCSGSDLIWY